jgi:NTE family protein
MPELAETRREMPRIGLVLGAGGAVGHAYHAGVLAGLAEATGWDPRSAELIVGTSAGSIVSAMLRAGLSAADLASASLRQDLSPAGAKLMARTGPRTRLETPGPQHADVARGPAAAGLLMRPWGVRPSVLAAALLPAGTVSTDTIAAGVRALFGTAWPEQATWICATRLEDGKQVAFGRAGSPTTSLAEAVAASCAIPAYFRPVLIGGKRYVDGGAHSVTNAELPAGLGFDLVIVSCPMGATREAVATGFDLPLRAAVRARLAREVAAVRRSGTPVLTFQPTRPERQAMGSNPMDSKVGSSVTRAARQSTLARLAAAEVQERLATLV